MNSDDDDQSNTVSDNEGQPHESVVAPVNVLQWKPPSDAPIDKIYEWEDAVEETVLAISVSNIFSYTVFSIL